MAEIKDCCSCIYETRSTFCAICVACVSILCIGSTIIGIVLGFVLGRWG